MFLNTHRLSLRLLALGLNRQLRLLKIYTGNVATYDSPRTSPTSPGIVNLWLAETPRLSKPIGGHACHPFSRWEQDVEVST